MEYDNICFVAAHPSGYEGNIVIPETVEFEGKIYTVVGAWGTEIKDWYSSTHIYSFQNCQNLKSITFPSTCVYVGSGFSDCTSLENICMPDEMIPISLSNLRDTAWYHSQPNGHIYLGKTYLGYKGGIEDPEEITIKEGTIAIGNCACKDMLGLKRVFLPNTIKIIGSMAFDNTSISEIRLPISLKYLSQYAITSALLTSLTLPDSIEEIGSFAFYSCNNLKYITFPNKLFDCSSFSFPAWYYNQPDGHIIIGDGIYLGYKGNIRDGAVLAIPEGVKYIADDGLRSEYGRNSYSNISELILPESLEKIGKWAFRRLNIRSLNIPEGVERLYASISGCSSLKRLELPSGLKQVDWLLYNCDDGCRDIFCNSETVPHVSFELFDQKWDPRIYTSCTLHVPEQSLESYRNDKHWGQFSNIVGDISAVDFIPDEIKDNHIDLYDLNGVAVYSGNVDEMKNNLIPEGIYIMSGNGISKTIYIK